MSNSLYYLGIGSTMKNASAHPPKIVNCFKVEYQKE